MSTIPKVLIIAGSDSGGGAGIQADIKAITFFKGFAMTAITAVTAQNTIGVQAIHPVPGTIVIDQINSVMEDLSPDIIKIGMLTDLDIINFISENLESYKIILDPVMVATSGDVLVNDDVINSIKVKLLEKSFLITPNIYEAEILSGKKINSLQDQLEIGKELVKMG